MTRHSAYRYRTALRSAHWSSDRSNTKVHVRAHLGKLNAEFSQRLQCHNGLCTFAFDLQHDENNMHWFEICRYSTQCVALRSIL